MYEPSLRFVYVTCKHRDEALAIGRALVAQKLAACVNILDGMHSIYEWQGAMEETQETVLIAKTEERLVPSLTEAVKAIHSYEVPCVVALPILGGNAAYLAWVESQLKG